ncbi:MAG: DoxX family membrane protein [Dysgonomonas sp.]
MSKQSSYTRPQTFWLVALRMLIGWHFLYEGLVKLLNPNWSAAPYLMDSQGWFSSFFQDLANNPTALSVVNTLNIYGLILIGLGLIMGCLSRYASIGAIIALCFYYLSHPPFTGIDFSMPSEGSYLWIDKNVIEICAIMVLLYFPTSHIFGLDKYLSKFVQKRQKN